MLVAPLLAQIKDVAPEPVTLRGSSFQMVVETKTERIVVRLDGVAEGALPELTVDRFLQTLRQDVHRASAVDEIQLECSARQLASRDTGALGAAVAVFTVECRLRDKKSLGAKR